MAADRCANADVVADADLVEEINATHAVEGWVPDVMGEDALPMRMKTSVTVICVEFQIDQIRKGAAHQREHSLVLLTDQSETKMSRSQPRYSAGWHWTP